MKIYLNQEGNTFWEGSKNGFNFSEGDYDSIDKFYIFASKSYKRIGLPIPSLQYFYNLINEFGDKSANFLSLENDDGTSDCKRIRFDI